jgi:hypothetical protein
MSYLTPEWRAELNMRHQKMSHYNECRDDGLPWPCAKRQLLDALDEKDRVHIGLRSEIERQREVSLIAQRNLDLKDIEIERLRAKVVAVEALAEDRHRHEIHRGYYGDDAGHCVSVLHLRAALAKDNE